MNRCLFALAGRALVLLLALPGTAVGATTQVKTIKVDCNKGQSIQAALGDAAAQLVVEVTGVCAQAVTITRDDVTLRGSNGAILDGTGLPTQTQVGITVLWASNVAIENLTVQWMRWGIRLEWGASTTLTNVVLQDNRTGLLVSNGSSASLAGLTAQRNVNFGITAWQGGGLDVTSGIVAANENTYGFILSGSSLTLQAGTRVEARDNVDGGIVLQLGASALLAAGTVVTNGNGGAGVYAFSGSSAGISNLEAKGNYAGVWADGAEVDLYGASITENDAAGVIATSAATVLISGSPSVGNTVSANGGNGIEVSQNSFLSIGRTTIQGNGQPGILVDGGILSVYRNSTVTGNAGADVALSFGARAEFPGQQVDVGTVTCDPTVLVRGSESCSPLPSSASSLTQSRTLGAASRAAGALSREGAPGRQPLQPVP